jgi:hypothetical protein
VNKYDFKGEEKALLLSQADGKWFIIPVKGD